MKALLEIFRDHGVIVAPLGTSLVNTLFFTRFASIIEIFPPFLDSDLARSMAATSHVGYFPVRTFNASSVWSTSKVRTVTLLRL